ncbi:chloramphenicol phosphotransferase CPT family protein [Nostoc sp. C110]|uniref:chloramphenicol phosphotransferase CPT family protein n=1 Tax=Nostoc sp. C110 TaxID=3349876 RepID=UPI00370D7902
MEQTHDLGQIIILNGTPRSGKSSIATAIQESFNGLWMNLGVDGFMQMTPARFLPGIGLRPGGERQDIEPLIPILYSAMYESIAAHSRLGINVVVDVGHHDAYAIKRGILVNCARRLNGLPVLFVGVRCPIEVIMERRWNTGQNMDTVPGSPAPHPIELWQSEVHIPGIYDMEVDTSLFSSAECVEIIRQQLANLPVPSAFQRLVALSAN